MCSIFVLMMIELTHRCFETPDPRVAHISSASGPVTALNSNSEIDTKRYQYWTGASDKRYICTVFKPGACPSVKTAVYIAVYRDDEGHVTPLTVGHFNSPFISGGKRSQQFAEALDLGANEVHIHLLADDPFEASQVSEDLQARLFPLDIAV